MSRNLYPPIEAHRSGWLREVHVCHSRAMKVVRCPTGNGPPDSVPVKIWRSF